MDTLLEQEKKKTGTNKTFIVGLAAGVLIIGGVLGFLALKPSIPDQTAKLLEGAYTEGSPEFEKLTKDVIISTDPEKTVESPMATGTISMFIHGNVRNKGVNTFSVLEVNVAVVTRFKQVLKEKRILVVPNQQPTLEPGQVIPLTLTLDGFDKEDERADIRWKVTAIKVK